MIWRQNSSRDLLASHRSQIADASIGKNDQIAVTVNIRCVGEPGLTRPLMRSCNNQANPVDLKIDDLRPTRPPLQRGQLLGCFSGMVTHLPPCEVRIGSSSIMNCVFPSAPIILMPVA